MTRTQKDFLELVMNGVINKKAHKAWLNTPNPSLENLSPLKYIKKYSKGDYGYYQVICVLKRLEWGVYE